MSRTTFILIGILYYVFTIITIIVVLNLISKKEQKKYKNEISTLERDKNLIVGASILSELNKVGALINNDVMQKKYDNWCSRLKEIKEVEVPKITDALIEIEEAFEEKNYKELKSKIAALELEIAYVKTKSNFLLDEVKEITLSEEKNRETITKLKSDYRALLAKYNSNKEEYTEVKTPLELQFENVDKLFSAFEKSMENNEYTEVGKIVKAIDDTIGNLKMVIEEAPSIILMGKKLIPSKIEEITKKQVKFYEGDVCDKKILEKIFKENKIEAVIHFASLKAVGESVEKPLLYYRNNLDATMSLLEVMNKYNCKKIVFSSFITSKIMSLFLSKIDFFIAFFFSYFIIKIS